MISKRAYEAYCNAVDNLTRAAASTVESRILEWVAANPGASVAEARDAAVAVMDDLVRKYGEAAATLAADWYDALAALAGKRIPPAVADASGAGSKTEKVARYQAAKLESGDAAGFARSCGEYAAHESKLALNRTVMANAKRDRRKGVRFARVPTGATTCSFCLMLASRGSVYYSRKTAGEFDRWHTHCDCKVVPGFEDDPDAELVEGFRPAELRARIAMVEEATGLKFSSSGDSAALRRYMSLLDEGWLMRGELTLPDYSRLNSAQRSRLKDYEVRAWESLARFGLRGVVLPEDAEAPANIDALIGGQLWELKNPKSGKHAVEDRIKEGAGKWKRLGLDEKPRIVVANSESDRSDDDVLAESERRCAWYGVGQLLFISHDGKSVTYRSF